MVGEHELKGNEKPEELIRVEKLIDDAKVNEAHELLDNFERKEGLTLHNKVTCLLLKCDLLYQQGRHKEVIMLAEETYKESLGLGKNILSVDALNIMAHALLWNYQIVKALDVITQGEELLKSVTQELSSEIMKREANILFVKGLFSASKSEQNLCLKYLKQSLELVEKTDLKRLNALILRTFGWNILHIKGDMEQAFEYVKQGVAVAKESKNKYTIAQCLLNLGVCFSFTGEWERALKIHKECLSIFEELDNKRRISTVFNNMADTYLNFTDDIDLASEFMEKSLTTYKVENNFGGASRLSTAIDIALKKGDHEQAKNYFQHLEQINSQVKDKLVEISYRLYKALLLKASSRYRDMAKAEKILKKIVEEEIISLDYTLTALVNLCDILLGEFRVTNNLEILNELEPLIAQLLNIAEKAQSHLIQAETYLFQAKLALLSFDVKKSRRFLTQAQQIAESHNLNKLALEISSEHKNLIDRLELWEQLKDSEAPLSERFKLAQISEQMERMHRTRVMIKTQIIEEKVAIHKERKICLVCKGEVLRFTYICECGAMYCENCARAVSDLENVCWACEEPIDYSKPVKPFKDEMENMKVEEKAKKQ